MIKELSSLKDKKVAILGFGREGQSTYRFLRELFPDKKLAILDKKPLTDWDIKVRNLDTVDKNVEIFSGEEYLAVLERFDLVIKTPGIPNILPELKTAEKKDVEFTSQTKLFFELCPGKIIGVTGTKGKSTTASLIYHILKTSGMPSVLLGNIGKPPLDRLEVGDKNTWYVFELSSHQLANLTRSPHIALLLNIFREHLDYYGNFNEYLAAKENITLFQESSDIFIYNADVGEFANIARRSKAKKMVFTQSKKHFADCYTDGDNLFIKDWEKEEKVLAINEIPLVGSHNILNCMAAILAGRAAGVATDDISKAIKSFKPLKTRLEVIGVFKGITFISDTLATIPEATIAAIEAYKGSVGTLICGGFDRGQDFSKLAYKIHEENINNLVLFPSTGEKILSELSKISDENNYKIIKTESMQEAVRFAFQNTSKGKVCLLSAASPSFTLFTDYEDERKQYIKEITRYA